MSMSIASDEEYEKMIEEIIEYQTSNLFDLHSPDCKIRLIEMIERVREWERRNNLSPIYNLDDDNDDDDSLACDSDCSCNESEVEEEEEEDDSSDDEYDDV